MNKGLFLCAFMLCGCAQSYGLVNVGEPYKAPDGSMMQLISGGTAGDQWGINQVTGLGVVRTGNTGSYVEGWSTSVSPSPAGIVAGTTVALGAAAATGATAAAVFGSEFNGIKLGR